MNKNLLTAFIALGAALSCSSCITQNSSHPDGFILNGSYGRSYHEEIRGAYHGDHADTKNHAKPLKVDSTDVHVICARAVGKSEGFKLLGFIPVRLASETEAINNMYQDARNRNCAPEGKASHFINHSIERSSNYRFLYSKPVVRASADLVEILPPGKGMDKLIARDAARTDSAQPAKEATKPAKSKSRKRRR